MGVYIKGMNMPNCCANCPLMFRADESYYLECMIMDGANTLDWNKVAHYCPLTEVPEPHGRLVDEEEIIKTLDRLASIPWSDEEGNRVDLELGDGERKSNVSEEEKEYLNKAFPEHDGGEWFDITDIMTKGETE